MYIQKKIKSSHRDNFRMYLFFFSRSTFTEHILIFARFIRDKGALILAATERKQIFQEGIFVHKTHNNYYGEDFSDFFVTTEHTDFPGAPFWLPINMSHYLRSKTKQNIPLSSEMIKIQHTLHVTKIPILLCTYSCKQYNQPYNKKLEIKTRKSKYKNKNISHVYIKY